MFLRLPLTIGAVKHGRPKLIRTTFITSKNNKRIHIPEIENVSECPWEISNHLMGIPLDESVFGLFKCNACTTHSNV